MECDFENQFNEITALLGEGDQRLGRTRLMKLCQAIPTAVGNWKQNGIPVNHQVTIKSHLEKADKKVPGWMLTPEIEVPERSDQIDAWPIRKSKAVRKSDQMVPA